MTQSTNGNGSGPLDRLKSEASGLLDAIGDKAVTSLKDSVEGATSRLTDYTKGVAAPGLKVAAASAKGLAEGKNPASAAVGAGMTAVKEKIGGMTGKGGGKSQKVTNIVESIDVGVPIKLAYDQWTRFTDFPSFMKKVESVDQQEDETVTWKANVLWSHRTWESTILEQVPEEKVVWQSKGAKGYVNGAVTFHELAPNLTRILVVLEYHPQGFFEHTGNLWRAQGRRARLELKHFQRYVMTEAILHPDDVDGWRGVISDGEVQQRSGRTRAGKNEGTKRSRAATTGAKPSTRSAGSGRRQSASSTGRKASTARGKAGQSTGKSAPSARSGSSGRGRSTSSAAPKRASSSRKAS